MKTLCQDLTLSFPVFPLKRRFGKSFVPGKASNDGESPALSQYRDNPKQSILFCNEREGGF